MSDADLLREAAAKMRERAYGATSEPWSVAVEADSENARVYSEFVATRYASMDPTVALITSPQYPRGEDDRDAKWGQRTDAEHIASWHPAVALAVADWLDCVAGTAHPHAINWQLGTEGGSAVAVARAYLGRDA